MPCATLRAGVTAAGQNLAASFPWWFSWHKLHSMGTSNWLTREQFAARYGLHRNTVDRLRKKGELKWFRIGRKVFLLPIDEAAESSKRAK